ncbi:hypothetical protein SP15_189 [Bacillus phage SP-15]|uniref:Uncharacterized protein n=1 Tax=Bacillus phage SP-15 TaxID=1792032 RepID=A0A127AWC2_9CAUD|nr:hypothetical protein SP15_189 [Bacillus phage SP-15]AMM44989.1 hypothetical protein SP15_189 [Bacillus phage SP-15]
MRKELTLGEFIEMTKDLPRGTKIVAPTSNTMEMGYSLVDANCRLVSIKKETKHFKDAFDHTPYSVEVYQQDKTSNEQVILIQG